ncbi:DUF676-domain-containing protein [Suhomyces tanzawaensis NRRL Y-17324]|uniref:DUF676-domain-containing protein n=1 Tax=Suhomyces tanzawaensis NRRL Y-17324 TaxID=984487 RepID=A0A1E4SC36_9ASCO|nr:DUF676-domain-containing protein [Suhomyces tanzawaensis NRRL Y-17324]ODV77026.1 DUF676-domain-containing protein [Suhomyces tanzawaensis NRRL Y-17324]
MPEPFLWYRDKHSLKIGEVNRYTVRYTRLDSSKNEIYLRLKNIEKTSIRAIHLLNGPFILYCHVVPYRYDYHAKFDPEDIAVNKEVVFENQIKPGQTFNVRLRMNRNSYVESVDSHDVFQWEIDVVSQIVITRNTSILYDLMIGDDFSQMKKLNHGSIQTSFSSIGNIIGNNTSAGADVQLGRSLNPQLEVVKKDTKQIWNTAPPDASKPVHLVIITHGVFSNLTADMLYIKDTLERVLKDNILIRGYRNNAGRTEKGVKRLGTALGDYLAALIDQLLQSGMTIDKISFVGHSLGGIVQLYAIKYLLITKGSDYFQNLNIQPYNLVLMASPLLGILSEMSFLISWFLDLGTLGKTGRDLTLSKPMPNLKDLKKNHNHNHQYGDEAAIKKSSAFKPVLEVLPDDPLQSFLQQFKHLTLYANAINDGIAPLRTTSLLYLDWKALGDVTELRKGKQAKLSTIGEEDHHLIQSNTTSDSVGEVPDDEPEDDGLDDDIKESQPVAKKSALEKYMELLHLNFNPMGPVSSSKHPKQKLSRKEKKFMKFNAKGSDYYEFVRNNKKEVEDEEDGQHEDDTLNDLDEEDEGHEDRPTFKIPPKASAVESAINTVLCPIPSMEYVFDPEHRDTVIFHDKYYHFKDLPKEEDRKSSQIKSFFFNYSDWKLKKQVKIARKYHTSKLNWRKVLVNLPPDAHNNIVVRRRFANGYGWGVVDHLCENLFNGGESEDDNGQDMKAKM